MSSLANILTEMAPARRNLPTPDFAGKVALRDAMRRAERKVDEGAIALAREETALCREFVHLNKKMGLTQDEAFRRAAAKLGPQCTLIHTAGNGGKTAMSKRNILQWLPKLRRGDGSYDWTASHALVRNYGGCGRRERAGDPRFWEVFHSSYLSRRQLSLPEAYAEATEEARRDGLEIATEDQVKYWVKHNVTREELVYSREGPEAWRTSFSYYNDRDWDSVLPGQILVCDHRTLDRMCRKYDPVGDRIIAVRPTLTAMMCAKTLRVVGAVITDGSGNCGTIMDCLLMAIWELQLTSPPYLHTDNGSDYKALGFGTPVKFCGEEYSVIKAIGSKSIFSIPYRAQAKTVERQFRNIRTGFCQRGVDYVGSKPGERSEIADYYYEHPELLPTVQELTLDLYEMLGRLHNKPSKGAVLKGKTPNEAWADFRPHGAQWTQEDLYRALLVPREIRTIERNLVRFQNRKYHSAELRRYCGLPGDRGKVLVYLDRYDPARIWCRTHDNQMIECVDKGMLATQALAETDEDRALLGESERYRRHQEVTVLGAVEDKTGGTYALVDPRDRFAKLRDPDRWKMVLHGERNSVKGGSHKHKHYVLEDKETGEPFRMLPSLSESLPHSLPKAVLTAGERAETEALDTPPPALRQARYDFTDDELADLENAVTNTGDTEDETEEYDF